MINFDLICDKEHAFEGWFANSAAYDAQLGAGSIRCPQCGSRKIAKAIMAPNISSKANSRKVLVPENIAPAHRELREFLHKMRSHFERNAEHVGEKFPEVARKIHYGERDAANIYGDATLEEVKELREEGIKIAAIPWIEPEN